MATLYKYETGGREVTYLDKEDVYQPEDIRKHWADTFPELGNAGTRTNETPQTITHEGEEVEVAKIVTFVKNVGTKGALPRYCRYYIEDRGGRIYLTPTMDGYIDRARAGVFQSAGRALGDLQIEWCPEDEQLRLAMNAPIEICPLRGRPETYQVQTLPGLE